ncbi:MAG: hypothetical protein WBV23_08685 [Desulfobaccales bacterium]
MVRKIPSLIKRLYAVVSELEALFPGRPFTLDGHLVGSLGEVLAAHRYGLELLNCSVEGHDAKAPNGILIQIKATQGSKVGLRSNPQHLIVILITKEGAIKEIFNGPGEIAWEHAGKMQKNGQRPITTTKLLQLMDNIPGRSRLPIVNH